MFTFLNKKVILSILFAISVIFCWSFFVNIKYWPKMDGHDAAEMIAQISIARQSVIKYVQPPFWTPAFGGGLNLLDYPTAISFSPFFLLILLFGEIVGLKIFIIVHLFLGLWGMYLLSRYLGCIGASCFMAPFIFFFSSIYPLQIAEGLYCNTSLAWIPWVFLYYLKCIESKDLKDLVLCVLFCVLILFGGGIYPVLYFILFCILVYSCFESWCSKNFYPLKVAVAIPILTCLLGAIRILPIFLGAMTHHFTVSVNYYNDIHVILNALFSKNQLLSIARHRIWQLPSDVSFWEQRGAYIGIIVFIVYLISLPTILKKYFALTMSSIVFLVLSLQDVLHTNSLMHFKNVFFPLVIILHCAPRFLWIFVFLLSIIAGLGLSQIYKTDPARKNIIPKTLVLGLLLFVTIDLFLVNSPIFSEAFIIPPEKIKENISFSQIKTKKENNSPRFYETILSNNGIAVDNAATLKKDLYLCNAIPAHTKRYRGEYYLANEKENDISLIYFSPNILKYKISIKKNDTLFINQNYHPDWYVYGLKNNRILCKGGLLAVNVTPRDSGTVIFYYLPPSFLLGFSISVISALIIFMYFKKMIVQKRFTYLILILFFIFCSSLFYSYLFAINKNSEFSISYRCAAEGIKHYRKGDFSQAMPMLEHASKYFPNSLILHQMLFDIYENIDMKEKSTQQKKIIDELSLT